MQPNQVILMKKKELKSIFSQVILGFLHFYIFNKHDDKFFIFNKHDLLLLSFFFCNLNWRQNIHE